MIVKKILIIKFSQKSVWWEPSCSTQPGVIKLMVGLHNHFANATKMVITAYIKIYSRILAQLLIHN